MWRELGGGELAMGRNRQLPTKVLLSAERKLSIRLAIYTGLLDRLAVVNMLIVRNWMGSFGSLNLSKIWDCRS